jgi:hypothetical protein
VTDLAGREQKRHSMLQRLLVIAFAAFALAGVAIPVRAAAIPWQILANNTTKTCVLFNVEVLKKGDDTFRVVSAKVSAGVTHAFFGENASFLRVAAKIYTHPNCSGDIVVSLPGASYPEGRDEIMIEPNGNGYRLRHLHP